MAGERRGSASLGMSVLTVMAHQRYPRQGYWTYDPYYYGECSSKVSESGYCERSVYLFLKCRALLQMHSYRDALYWIDAMRQMFILIESYHIGAY